MHDQLWDCLIRRVISLPNNVHVAIKAVIPEVQHGATPLYHTWGVLNPDYTGEVTPLSFPLAVEADMAHQGIHMHMNPQRLRGEWLDTICACGTPDIVFRSTSDLLAYQALTPQMKPFLVSKVSGQRANLGGREVVLSKPLGPYRLTLYNLRFTGQAAIQSLLSSANIPTDGYEVRGTGPRQTHLIGFEKDELRFHACQLLAHQSFAGINQGNPLQASLDVGCPSRNCFHCYHPDNPSLSKGHTQASAPTRVACAPFATWMITSRVHAPGASVQHSNRKDDWDAHGSICIGTEQASPLDDLPVRLLTRTPESAWAMMVPETLRTLRPIRHPRLHPSLALIYIEEGDSLFPYTSPPQGGMTTVQPSGKIEVVEDGVSPASPGGLSSLKLTRQTRIACARSFPAPGSPVRLTRRMSPRLGQLRLMLSHGGLGSANLPRLL